MATSTTPQTYTADCSETPPPAWTLTLEVARNVAEIRSQQQQEAVSQLVRALAST